MRRREFLIGLGCGLAPLFRCGRARGRERPEPERPASVVSIFLSGDVMTGRGIDQALPHPSEPRLYEPYVTNAGLYLQLAERAHGTIETPLEFSSVWGDLLDELRRRAPDAKIVNLETAVTRSDRPWPGKGIHYRMNPGNAPVLTAAGLDCCALANNHVLDWGLEGLEESLESLRLAGIATAGAGSSVPHARRPAILEIRSGTRLLVFSFGSTSSGIPTEWRATPTRAGIWLLEDLSQREAERIAAVVSEAKRPGDIVVASIHWGSNWGYDIPPLHRSFAHDLVDRAGVDVVHGHSSHHPRGIEVYRGRPVFYGCGDLLNDYEGISGHERYRGDLALGYWLGIDSRTGELAELEMTPLRRRRFRLGRAEADEARWLAGVLDRESRRLGTRVELSPSRTLRVRL